MPLSSCGQRRTPLNSLQKFAARRRMDCPFESWFLSVSSLCFSGSFFLTPSPATTVFKRHQPPPLGLLDKEPYRLTEQNHEDLKRGCLTPYSAWSGPADTASSVCVEKSIVPERWLRSNPVQNRIVPSGTYCPSAVRHTASQSGRVLCNEISSRSQTDRHQPLFQQRADQPALRPQLISRQTNPEE